MRILLSVAGFFPAQKYGGPAVSVRNICRLLQPNNELYIVTCDHEMNEKTRLEGIASGWNHYEGCLVSYLPENRINYIELKRIVEEIEPDAIYVNSLFDVRFTIPFLRIARNTKIPVVIAPRGEICQNAFNSKYKKIPFLLVFRSFFKLKNVYFHATADDEEQQIKKYIRKDNIFKVSNIPSICSSSPHGKTSGDTTRCVFIARIQRKKNLLGALSILKMCKTNITFDIYGPKEVPEYWNECAELIRKEPQNIVVRYCGSLNHDQVMSVFSKYDLFLFPTYSENYGHSIIESLQAGTPVLISNQTPWNDLDEYDAGWAIPLDDLEQFSRLIDSISSMEENDYYAKSSNAQKYVNEKLQLDQLKKAYIHIFKTIIA